MTIDEWRESVDGRLATIEWALYSLLSPCNQDEFIKELSKHHPDPEWLKRMHMGEFTND